MPLPGFSAEVCKHTHTLSLSPTPHAPSASSILCRVLLRDKEFSFGLLRVLSLIPQEGQEINPEIAKEMEQAKKRSNDLRAALG